MWTSVSRIDLAILQLTISCHVTQRLPSAIGTLHNHYFSVQHSGKCPFVPSNHDQQQANCSKGRQACSTLKEHHESTVRFRIELSPVIEIVPEKMPPRQARFERTVKEPRSGPRTANLRNSFWPRSHEITRPVVSSNIQKQCKDPGRCFSVLHKQCFRLVGIGSRCNSANVNWTRRMLQVTSGQQRPSPEALLCTRTLRHI